MTPNPQLAMVEAAYLAARSARDRLDVARATGEPADTAALERASEAAFAAVRAAFDLLRTYGRPMEPEDRRAITAMLEGLEQAERYLLPGVVPDEPAPGEEPATGEVPAPDDATAPDPAWPTGGRAGVTITGWTRPGRTDAAEAYHHDRLALEAAYSAAAGALVFDGRPRSRLQVLGRLAVEPDAERRRSLFLSLDPLWRAIDGNGGPGSPYRALIRRSAVRWRSGRSPIAANAHALGVRETDVAAWAMTVLAGWRAAFVEPARERGEPGVEPWDWWWRAGEAHRALAAALPLEVLAPVNHAYHAALGADLDGLGVVFDIHPRPGRPTVPVAFTTFGERPLQLPDGSWTPGRPTVLETLTEGGLGELSELMHETGHAIHLAGIRTRPAFADWPDSDAMTEALGELLALDAFDPRWQRRWLPGSPSVSDAVAVRGRYAEIALDAAWALFEIQLHEDPERRPNDLWTEITRTWLGIAPHGEWSWWAMRGQLVEGPGYMANYAIGAVLAADLREAIRRARGDWIEGDRGWYPWVREHIYRFGLERSTHDVVTGVLGRAPTADALLAQVSRALAG